MDFKSTITLLLRSLRSKAEFPALVWPPKQRLALCKLTGFNK